LHKTSEKIRKSKKKCEKVWIVGRCGVSLWGNSTTVALFCGGSTAKDFFSLLLCRSVVENLDIKAVV